MQLKPQTKREGSYFVCARNQFIKRHHLLLDGGRLPVAVYILLEVGLLLLLLLRLLLSATAGRRGTLEEFAVQQRLQLSLLRQVVVELRLRLMVALSGLLLGSLPAPVSGMVLRRSLLLHKVGRGLRSLCVETAAVHVGWATTALLQVAGKTASAATHVEAGRAVGTQSLRSSCIVGAVLRAVAASAVAPTTWVNKQIRIWLKLGYGG